MASRKSSRMQDAGPVPITALVSDENLQLHLSSMAELYRVYKEHEKRTKTLKEHINAVFTKCRIPIGMQVSCYKTLLRFTPKPGRATFSKDRAMEVLISAGVPPQVVQSAFDAASGEGEPYVELHADRYNVEEGPDMTAEEIGMAWKSFSEYLAQLALREAKQATDTLDTSKGFK